MPIRRPACGPALRALEEPQILDVWDARGRLEVPQGGALSRVSGYFKGLPTTADDLV